MSLDEKDCINHLRVLQSERVVRMGVRGSLWPRIKLDYLESFYPSPPSTLF